MSRSRSSTATSRVKEKGDGFAGARVASFDKIRFIPVPDVGTRVSGVQAGDYDYAEMISGDLYESLSKDPSVQVQRTNAPIFGLFFMNSKEGILKDNYKLRRAIQTALDKSQALRVAFGPKDLWNAEGSIFPKGTPWYSTDGASNYSQHDPKKAKELAKEADYTGTPIRLLVSTNYQAHYDEASVFTRQLAEAGINVQMMVVDWATLLKMRGQPEQWDIFVTHHCLRARSDAAHVPQCELSRLVGQPGDRRAADRVDQLDRSGRAQGRPGTRSSR